MLTAAIEQLGPGGHWQLTRLHVPAGGGSMWEVETRKGTISEQSLDCIVAVLRMKQRAWYRRSYDETGGGAPPDCSSTDSIEGFGNPGDDETAGPARHSCQTCARNVFRKDEVDFGTECGEYAQALVFRVGSRLPNLLHIPITSLKAWRKYVLALAEDGLPVYNAVTRVALEQDKSRNGIKFSRMVPTSLRDLTEEEAAFMADIHGACALWLAANPMPR
jgi:hypothetical protein